MAVSTSTTSQLPLLFLHRGATNPTPSTLSFPSSLRASSLRSRAAAAPPAETLSEDGIPDTPPEGEGTGIPLPSSIGDDGEQLLFGATAGKETVVRPYSQLRSSFSDSFGISQKKIVIRNRYGGKLVGVLHEAGSKEIIVLCHGFRSSKESRTILSLADALTSENISVFRFDFSGNGESEGTFQYGNYYKELAPKQKIRIKLRSYWVPLIEDSCKKIIEAAKTTNAKTMGPVPLPTKRRVYCVLNSPHVHKDSRFHFEIRTHQRLIDIMYPTAQTIDSLMQLQLPAGVDVEVKL
ncbi:hypothetical protein PR202_ga26736 [Eleusine coracana subsp. coracana]|uniref:Small ribosomal subunit protein uS10c n=1 Tax=Eleusine coracana subsp. coracana TaxID=191504 RepID=A0AAV5DEB2_ELECO|nr:hypothetical protein PR202_ga26736 [Eleusine coracana subsp. coracana]